MIQVHTCLPHLFILEKGMQLGLLLDRFLMALEFSLGYGGDEVLARFGGRNYPVETKM